MLTFLLIIFRCIFADFNDHVIYSQFLGTHDSAHERPNKWDASTWFQYEGGLTGQLDLGVRLLEFTIWDGQFTTSTWHPYANSICSTLSNCFSQLTRWHVQNPDHAPIFIKLQFAHDFSLSDFTALDSALPSLLPSDVLLTPSQMLQFGHANWSSVTVGNLRGKFVLLITDYENYLFDNHALEIWQTLNSFIICDDFIWRYQFPFPDFCWFVKYDVPSSTHDEKYVGTLQAQRHGRLVLMDADRHFSQHPDCTPFGTYVRCTGFDGFQTARKWGWSLALQMADTNDNGFLSLREGSALFRSLGIEDDWRIPLELEINDDLVELTYPDATNYPDIVVSHSDQQEQAALVLQSGANFLLTNWPSEIYTGQPYSFNFLADSAEWSLSARMKEELWEIDESCIDDNIKVNRFASNSRIPWVTHCDLFALVLEEYHGVTCDLDSEVLESFGFPASLPETCCDTCRRQENHVPFEFEGCSSHDDCESSDYFCASCALCSFHSVNCPLCGAGVQGVCIPLEKCALGVSIDNACPDYLVEPAKCSKAALLTSDLVSSNNHCSDAFSAYYSYNFEVYMHSACECFRSTDFSKFTCALDHSHHSLSQSWNWCRSSACESIIDEYICTSRKECAWRAGMILGFCILEGTYSPTRVPSGTPTGTPSRTPSLNPGWSQIPSWNPSLSPTSSANPTKAPVTTKPTLNPTFTSPSHLPSASPHTSNPTKTPIVATSQTPTNAPTSTTIPTSQPSKMPSKKPSATSPTSSPETTDPTFLPSESPIITDIPTHCPTTPKPTTPPLCDQTSLGRILNRKASVECDLYRSRITRNLFVTEGDRCGCLMDFSNEEAESFECLASPVETDFLVIQWVKCTAPLPTKAPSLTTPPPSETCTQLQMYTMFVTPLYSSLCIKYTSIVLGIATDMSDSEKCECVQSFTTDFLSQMNCRPALDAFTFPEQHELCNRNPTTSPVRSPSYHPLPTAPTRTTASPSESPQTYGPSRSPETSKPSRDPSKSPETTEPTRKPTNLPTKRPSDAPTTTATPTASPSTSEPTTTNPTALPTISLPSNAPSTAPSIGEVIQYWNSAVTVLFTFFETAGCAEVHIGEISFFNNKGKTLHCNSVSSPSADNIGDTSNLFDDNVKSIWGGDLDGCGTQVSVMATGIPPSLASFAFSISVSNSETNPTSWNTQVCDSSCKTFCFRNPTDLMTSKGGHSLVGGMIYFAVVGLDGSYTVDISVQGQTKQVSRMGAFVFDCALLQGDYFSVATNSGRCQVQNGNGVMDTTDIFVTVVCSDEYTQTTTTTTTPHSTSEAIAGFCSSSGGSCTDFLRIAYNATRLATEESHARTLIRTIRSLTSSISDYIS